MIETNFDIPFVAALAAREKQIQQSYRPVIAVHKWFARRPGTLFRSLLLSEFFDDPLPDIFYESLDLSGKTVADPFMGGGTPLLEANRLGAEVLGRDINPMSWWIVGREIEDLDPAAYRRAAEGLRRGLGLEVGSLYRTRCVRCGNPRASAKYYLWVKTAVCRGCGRQIDLLPGNLVSENVRHPRFVLVCVRCGGLAETDSKSEPGPCPSCGESLKFSGAAGGRVACPGCGTANAFPDGGSGPPRHRLFAMEYHCPECGRARPGRLFKAPDEGDLAILDEAGKRAGQNDFRFVPDDPIPPGDETDRLFRWGYRRYRDLFNDRQLVGLEACARLVAGFGGRLGGRAGRPGQPGGAVRADGAVRRALATNFSDLLRYQNMLCRYDTRVLKSLDVFSVHGFPVGLVQCESNMLGVSRGGSDDDGAFDDDGARGNKSPGEGYGGKGGQDGKDGQGPVVPVGSGGWLNVMAKYARAKAWCRNPVEVRHESRGGGERKIIVPMAGEWVGEKKPGHKARRVSLSVGDAASAGWKSNSVDAVLTDPPYFGNVQYAELMDFCYVWLRRLCPDEPAFLKPTARSERELTGNETMGRGLAHFASGLAEAFKTSARALRPGGPLAFTFHHNDPAAYLPVAQAVLDAGLVCTAALPCPGEMGASVHIRGTSSSTLDTVFVCRAAGSVPPPPEDDQDAALASDIGRLNEAGLKVTPGDRRCLRLGHLAKNLVNRLAGSWDAGADTPAKLKLLAREAGRTGDAELLGNLAGKV